MGDPPQIVVHTEGGGDKSRMTNKLTLGFKGKSFCTLTGLNILVITLAICDIKRLFMKLSCLGVCKITAIYLMGKGIGDGRQRS